MARTAATAALADIDPTRPILLLWLNGTGDRGAEEEFFAAARRRWGARVEIVKIAYPARYDYRASVSTGIEALGQVLDGVAQLRRNRRVQVLLAAESQGAWVVSDTIADARRRAAVDRVLLVGHPSVAEHHFHDGRDPGVFEFNHRTDPITLPVSGPVEGMLDAVGALVERKDPSGLGNVVAAAVHNPLRALDFLVGSIRGAMFGSGGKPDQLVHDPHNYRDHAEQMVAVLAGYIGPRS